MIYLLIDNSNTRTKFILADAQGFVSEKRYLLTAQIKAEGAACVTALLHDWNYQQAVACSVVPACRAALQEGLAAPCHFLAWNSPHDVDFDSYPDKEGLGADRIANVLALRKRGYAASIAIDLGTAITYDVLVKKAGRYHFVGGVIAPGLAALRDYLHTQTAQLPEVELRLPQKMIAQNTREAMQVGILMGFYGMLRETITRLCAELEDKPTIIATGGDAAMAAAYLDDIDACCDDLTLEGLHYLACLTDDLSYLN